MTIEEYGTLSEEELIQEIMNQLEEKGDIDSSELDFKFEDDKLKITGTLQSEDELEALVGVLEDYVDPKDYRCEVEILEEAGIDSKFGKAARFPRPIEDDADEEEDEDDEDDEDEDDFDEEDELDEGEEEKEPDFDELEEEDDEDEDDKDENKW